MTENDLPPGFIPMKKIDAMSRGERIRYAITMKTVAAIGYAIGYLHTAYGYGRVMGTVKFATCAQFMDRDERIKAINATSEKLNAIFKQAGADAGAGADKRT